MAALLRWNSWKGLAIPREPRLVLQPQVASESTINYDAAHSANGMQIRCTVLEPLYSLLSGLNPCMRL